MTDWPLRTWKTSPFAYYTCVVPFLALSYSASLEDVEFYDKNHAVCTDRFVSLLAKALAYLLANIQGRWSRTYTHHSG